MRMDVSMETEPLLYSRAQNRILSTIPTVLGFLSFWCSSLIIYVIFKDRRLWKNSYDRIILGLCVFDALSSFGFAVFGPWAVPEDVSYVVGARASSTVPCDIAGWFTNMLFGSILYTASLMIYFILLIKLEWRPERIAKRVEPWLHGTSVGITVLTGSYAVSQSYMNPLLFMPGTCWLAGHPPKCTFSDEIDCVRGGGGTNLMRIMASFPIITFIVVVATMILLVLKIRTTELRVARYQFRPNNNNNNNNTGSGTRYQTRPSNNNTGSGSGSQRTASSSSIASSERTRRTAFRGLAYIGAFFLSFLPPAIFVISFGKQSVERSQASNFAQVLVIVCFVPLQGVFNAAIYLHPKWHMLTHRKDSTLYWLAQGLRTICCCCCSSRGEQQQEQSQPNNSTSTTGVLRGVGTTTSISLLSTTTTYGRGDSSSQLNTTTITNDSSGLIRTTEETIPNEPTQRTSSLLDTWEEEPTTTIHPDSSTLVPAAEQEQQYNHSPPPPPPIDEQGGDDDNNEKKANQDEEDDKPFPRSASTFTTTSTSTVLSAMGEMVERNRSHYVAPEDFEHTDRRITSHQEQPQSPAQQEQEKD